MSIVSSGISQTKLVDSPQFFFHIFARNLNFSWRQLFYREFARERIIKFSSSLMKTAKLFRRTSSSGLLESFTKKTITKGTN